MTYSESLHDQIQRLEREFNPGRSIQDRTRYQWTNRAVHYRQIIISQKTARSVVGVETITFGKVATVTIKTSASTEKVTTAYIRTRAHEHTHTHAGAHTCTPVCPSPRHFSTFRDGLFGKHSFAVEDARLWSHFRTMSRGLDPSSCLRR